MFIVVDADHRRRPGDSKLTIHKIQNKKELEEFKRKWVEEAFESIYEDQDMSEIINLILNYDSQGENKNKHYVYELDEDDNIDSIILIKEGDRINQEGHEKMHIEIGGDSIYVSKNNIQIENEWGGDFMYEILIEEI